MLEAFSPGDKVDLARRPPAATPECRGRHSICFNLRESGAPSRTIDVRLPIVSRRSTRKEETATAHDDLDARL
jgi:hypothetical protein